MDHAEAIAKRVLEIVIPNATMTYQADQSHGEYDFNLKQEGVPMAAVEVTSAVDRAHTATMAAIRGKRGGGAIIQATDCKKSWMIFPAKDARINEIRNKADRYLSKLEHAGIEKFFLLRRHDPCVVDLCHDLQIVGGSVITSTGSPKIFINAPVTGGAVGPSIAVQAGEREAWKDDNRKKLGAAKTNARYLVVYIDVSNGLPWVALTDFDPPPDAADLPKEVTDLWLIGHDTHDANEFVVWHGSIKGPWQRIPV